MSQTVSNAAHTYPHRAREAPNRTAVHFTYMRAAVLCPRYPYGGMAYADPDAVTQIANGLSTTTFTYDNNGNVTQKTVSCQALPVLLANRSRLQIRPGRSKEASNED